jgi:hypothetical protein
MPSSQEWDNSAKTVYRIEFNGKWTWADFNAAIDESNRAMAAQAPAKVDLIICINTALPPGNAMPHLRHAGGMQPPNTNRSVMVNESGLFLERVVQTVDKAKRWDGPAIVKTLAEARDLLSRQGK